MTYGQYVFDQPVKNYVTSYDNIPKIPKVKEMITQPVVYWITFIPRIIIR